MNSFLEKIRFKHFFVFLTTLAIILLLLTLVLLQPIASYVAASTDDAESQEHAGDASHGWAFATLGLNATPNHEATEFDGPIYQSFNTANYSVDAINTALINCPSGQGIRLAAGTYLLDGVINVPAGKTLAGSTDGAGGIGTIITTDLPYADIRSNAYINIGAGGNAVRNIKTLDGYYFFGLNSHDFLIQDCEYNGPADASAGQYCLYGFFIYIAANGVYDNGQFIGCVAKNAPCFGFLVTADGTKNSDHYGADAYSAHNWQWTDCKAYDCGLANMNFSIRFVYGCGFDFFEGFGQRDEVAGMRITNSVANGNVADGFHIEDRMDVTDCVFIECIANNNGQWFKLGHTTNPAAGVLIGTGFWLGGADTSQTKVVKCLAQNNWGYSTKGKGYGMVDSQMHTDEDGTYAQGTGVS